MAVLLPPQSRTELGEYRDDSIVFLHSDARKLLDLAVGVLPRRPARLPRDLIAPFDRAFLAKTLPDPFADPWWLRRIAGPYQRRPLTPREQDEADRQAELVRSLW